MTLPAWKSVKKLREETECTALSNDLPSRAAALAVGRELAGDEDCV